MADDAFDASNNERLSTDNLTAEDLTPLQTIDPPAENEGKTDNIRSDSASAEEDPRSSGAKEGGIKMQVQSPAMNANPLIAMYKWTIENFSNFPDLAYSGTFLARGYRWRILISGRGNPSGNLSVYLDFADAETRREQNVFAEFRLTVVNQRISTRSIARESHHQFNDKCRDWGFSSFMPMSDLFELDKGYIIDDTLIVQAEVLVKGTSLSGNSGYNRETGYVGLENLGNTCYLNSAIQTLYHIPYLRSVVYHMPTTGSDNQGINVPLALYNLFYELEHSNTSVSTRHLIESLGWNNFNVYEQNDVQEFNKLLCATLEDKMKGTALDGTIKELFEGHLVYYIKCIHVEQQSVRMEPYLDLQLDVKGCPDIYASFDKYCEAERMEGENKYQTEKYGLQDAKRGCLFNDFPPVLFLHLNRVEFDSEKGRGFKILDRYEYPMVLDLDKGNRKYLSSDSDKTIQNLFTLYSVFVHRGRGVQEGHYYAFIRAGLSNRWFKFDDERVTEVDALSALHEQYGGEEELLPVNPGFKDTPFKDTKYANAYTLVYVRDSDKDKIVSSVEEKDITRKRLKRDQGENEIPKDKKKVKTSSLHADQHTVIKVVQDSSLKNCLENNMDFELIDFERKFEYEKSTPFQVFKDDLAVDLNIGIQFMRLWHWDYDNHHISRSLSLQEEALTVGELHQTIHNLDNDALHLFVEYEHGADQQPIPLKDKSDDDMLLLFMLYDPEKVEIRYMGKLYVKASGSPFEFFSKLNQMAEFSPDEAIVLYKVEKSPSRRVCKSIDKDITFQSYEFHDGDIICYQKAPVEGRKEKILYPDFPSFLEYANNHREVHFRLLGIPSVDVFCLELSMLLSYDDVVARVAQKIKIDDHSKILLTSHDHLLHKPMPQPIERFSIKHLSDMLCVSQDLSVMLPDTQKNDILYFEVLRTHPPSPSSINLLIMFRKSGDKAQLGYLTVQGNSTVGDVLNVLRRMVSFQLSVPDAQLRLLQLRSYKIYKILADDEYVMNIDGSDKHFADEGFIAEEIPEEEKNLGPNDVLVNVFHFKKSDGLLLVPFGEPFCLTVREGETLADIKPRIRMKLQISVHGYSKISADEYAKWGFACCSNDQVTYLQDSFLVASFFKNFGAIPGTNQLGLEHEDPWTKEKHNAEHQHYIPMGNTPTEIEILPEEKTLPGKESEITEATVPEVSTETKTEEEQPKEATVLDVPINITGQGEATGNKTDTTQRTARIWEHLKRAGWVRSAAVGANDGLLSTASMMVSAGAIDRSAMLISGFGALAGGACSKGIGEYVSVSAQNQLQMENREGPPNLLSPLKAAIASFLAFALGAALPLLSTGFISDFSIRMSVLLLIVVAALVTFGVLGAKLAGLPVDRRCLRPVSGGVLIFFISVGLLKAGETVTKWGKKLKHKK